MVNNLPGGLPPLVGRRGELADVRRLLAHNSVLTLVGPGGIGKTRLALAAAADRERAFADGVGFVPLDGLDDPQRVAAHVTAVLGLVEQPHEQGALGSLATALRGRQMLLVLDNCEHLCDSVSELVDHLVGACPALRILTTSRSPLSSIGQAAYAVPPLSLPPDAARRAGARSEAVELFVERALATEPSFKLSSGNERMIQSLVEHLEGLPLAIELAAAQLSAVSLDDLLASVGADGTDGVELTWSDERSTGGSSTLHASLMRTWRQCTIEERDLWANLSVFRGSFDLAAAEAVAGVNRDLDDFLDLLQALVERSVVRRTSHRDKVRFSMLNIVRGFGAGMLTAEAAEVIRHRHAEWYLDLACRAEREWNSANQAHWLSDLPLERDNINDALTHALATPPIVDQAVAAIVALWRYYWWARGWSAEGIYWVGRAISQVQSPKVEARLALLGALLAHVAGRTALASEWQTRGSVAAERSGDPLALAMSEHVLGDAAMYRGSLSEAMGHFRAALVLMGDRWPSSRADTLLMLGLACASAADLDGAETAHSEVLSLLNPDEQFQRSYALFLLGEALRRSGRTQRAWTTAGEALRLNASLEDPFGTAWNLAILAAIAADAADFRGAATVFGAALSRWRAMGADTAFLERLQIHEHELRDRLSGMADAKTIENAMRQGAAMTLSELCDLVTGSAGAVSKTVYVARSALTPRETEVTALVADGLTNRQIAQRLVVSQRTVDSYVQSTLLKLGFHSRAQIAAWHRSRSAASAPQVAT